MKRSARRLPNTKTIFDATRSGNEKPANRTSSATFGRIREKCLLEREAVEFFGGRLAKTAIPFLKVQAIQRRREMANLALLSI